MLSRHKHMSLKTTYGKKTFRGQASGNDPDVKECKKQDGWHTSCKVENERLFCLHRRVNVSTSGIDTKRELQIF